MSPLAGDNFFFRALTGDFFDTFLPSQKGPLKISFRWTYLQALVF
jgi:hypothetical protein